MGRGSHASSAVFALLSLLLVSLASAMAEGGALGVPEQQLGAIGESKEEEATVHIVHVSRAEDVEPAVHHIRTLASVVGSEEAAKEALIYSYTTAASGFAAKLTPQQAEEISKQPGVLMVQPEQVLELASGGATLGM